MNYLKNTDYVLKITGQISDSEEDQKIWNYIKENQLESKVIFTGFKYGVELEDLISKATCVVCPAIWYENMPNTVIEAYAYGKPVVASRIGSLAEIVVDGKTGMLFRMKDAEDMAEKHGVIFDTSINVGTHSIFDAGTPPSINLFLLNSQVQINVSTSSKTLVAAYNFIANTRSNVPASEFFTHLFFIAFL